MSSLLITKGLGNPRKVAVPPPGLSAMTSDQKKLQVRVDSLTTEDTTDTKQLLKVKVESVND